MRIVDAVPVEDKRPIAAALTLERRVAEVASPWSPITRPRSGDQAMKHRGRGSPHLLPCGRGEAGDGVPALKCRRHFTAVEGYPCRRDGKELVAGEVDGVFVHGTESAILC